MFLKPPHNFDLNRPEMSFRSESIAHSSILKAVKTFTRTKPNLQGIAMHAKQVI